MGNKHKIYYIAAIVIFMSFCDVLASSDSDEIKVIVERNVPVPMRDGTILRADIHRPDRGGPYPVLVKRTPYGKGGDFDRFVKAGYIVVSQDVRGRYESDGSSRVGVLLLPQDAEDGYDTVEWAAILSRSNGKVGTFGASAPASQQWLLASLNPPHLVAMAAQCCGVPRRYTEPTGALRPVTLEFIFLAAAYDWRRADLPGPHTEWEQSLLWKSKSDKWINFLPWLDLPEGFFGSRGMYDHFKLELNDLQFDPWKANECCKNITVPNFDTVGWHDRFNGDMLMFRTMVSKAKTEVARNGSRIIIGPWTHTERGKRRVGDFDFGSYAELDKIAMQIRWFDYWLKGIQNGVDKDPPVKIFIMGDNKWRDEQCWPLKRTKDRIIFVTSNGHANTPSGDGRLIQKNPEQAGTDQYLYDPKDPVPSLNALINTYMPIDQRPLADRNDILVYQSEQLSERFEVTGNPIVELYASSSAPDTDWFVRLIDVAPTGLARNVSCGAIRARYRGLSIYLERSLHSLWCLFIISLRVFSMGIDKEIYHGILVEGSD